MTPVSADDLLVRYLGPNLQAATIRLIGGMIAISALVALIVWLF
jgi:hypothetical protein